jgi:RecB family exonuclease
MQHRRLVRARDLASFRHALVTLSIDGAPLAARRRAVIVPTRASGELLRETIERRLVGTSSAAFVLPDILTRAEFLEHLLAALPGQPRLLSRAEREVLIERSARATGARQRMGGPPFQLRPGLIGAMLEFYDELKRRQGSVLRMAGELFRQLDGERGTDRGSDSLIRQTCFLGFTFLAYERAVATSGGWDEHALRAALIDTQPSLPYDHVVIGVADQPSDPRGLWPADFDLLGRLRRLDRIDVVVTDGAHDAGFRVRIEQELPGLEEDRFSADAGSPVLVRPADADTGACCFICRDREEELRSVSRTIRERAATTGGALRDRTAVVFHRPLPYLYLAQQVLTEARIPYRAFDALPLASEPYAAVLDIVLAVARTGGTRSSSVELLRSRLLQFEHDGAPILSTDVSSLDLALTERRAGGEARSFSSSVEAYFKTAGSRSAPLRDGAVRAARAAATASDHLDGFRDAPHASAQVRAISTFLRAHERLPQITDQWRERHLRARGAVLAALDGLSDAFERHDDAPRRHEDLVAAIGHAIEAQTFTPLRGSGGVHLVDAVAARFGEFDHAHLVGLVETDWPERPKRNIFFTSGLLSELGWPQDMDQARVERAAFTDLLALPAKTVRLSAFKLEGDTIVGLSPIVELARDVVAEDAPLTARARIFDDEVMTAVAPETLPLEPGAAAWLRQRHARPDMTGLSFTGSAGPQPPQRYRISRVDHYVDCPFKYFAENVLGLPEEREESAGLSPLERGTLIHRLFEQFFRDWDADPGGAVTAASLPDAIARFSALAERELAGLPEADRALERTRLLGSLVAPGVALRVFELEADTPGAIAGRLLETDLRGIFEFPQLGGLKSRSVDIHGKADRIDVLESGAVRVVDYKLTRLPDKDDAIQIAVYAHAAQAKLQAADGRSHPIDAAMYLAFGDEDEFQGSLGNTKRSAADVVRARVEQFADIIDRIEAGEFPARPSRMDMCSWCRYAGVCRKEYRVDDDEAAQSV